MKRIFLIAMILVVQVVPVIANASIESAMYTFRSQLSGIFLPALALVGIVLAGISLAFGHQNAKQHISMAVLGSIVGFGADNIIDFVRRTFGGV